MGHFMYILNNDHFLSYSLLRVICDHEYQKASMRFSTFGTSCSSVCCSQVNRGFFQILGTHIEYISVNKALEIKKKKANHILYRITELLKPHTWTGENKTLDWVKHLWAQEPGGAVNCCSNFIPNTLHRNYSRIFKLGSLLGIFYLDSWL